MDPHRLGELRSIALHREIASRIRDDAIVLERARARVAAWLVDGRVHPEHAEAWRALLAGSTEALCDALTRDDEEMRTLRSVTPFAGVVDPRTRWRIWREVA
jgi:hypothetical protein